MNTMADAYATQNVMMTFGYDFTFYDAPNTFGLMDDIIDFLKYESPRLKFIYSTASKYLSSIEAELQQKPHISFETYSGDFFPMEQIYPESFWTGYYTSRSNSKGYMREYSAITRLSNTLRGFESLVSKSHCNSALVSLTYSMDSELALM